MRKKWQLSVRIWYYWNTLPFLPIWNFFCSLLRKTTLTLLFCFFFFFFVVIWYLVCPSHTKLFNYTRWQMRGWETWYNPLLPENFSRIQVISHVGKSYANWRERNRLFIERTHECGDGFLYLSCPRCGGTTLISSFQPCFNSVMLSICFF